MGVLQISDIRERRYEESGQDSSYLFRIDDEHVVRPFLFRMHWAYQCMSLHPWCDLAATSDVQHSQK